MKEIIMIRKTIILLIPLYFLIFFSGCTANLTEPEIDFEPPAYVEQMPAKEDGKNFTSTGSIFGQGDNPLFSDHKAMHVNDIVKVVISENAQSSNSGAKQLSKDDSTNLGGGLFATTGDSKTVNKYIGKLNAGGDIGFKSATTNSFKGQSSVSNDASFSATISARIVKVLENGNYFISGKREILVDDQKQIVQISGVIRPYDIDQYNKIDSAQMSDAKILYKTEGDSNRATQQGWGSKAIQSIWPF